MDGRSYAVFLLSDGSVRFETFAESGGFTALNLPAESVEVGQWYELAVVIDRSTSELTMYLNGEPEFGDIGDEPGVLHIPPHRLVAQSTLHARAASPPRPILENPDPP